MELYNKWLILKIHTKLFNVLVGKINNGYTFISKQCSPNKVRIKLDRYNKRPKTLLLFNIFVNFA